jgi:hypothetical protein
MGKQYRCSLEGFNSFAHHWPSEIDIDKIGNTAAAAAANAIQKEDDDPKDLESDEHQPPMSLKDLLK